MNPKVSVIVPVYNTEKYIKECLDSIVNQTLQDIEIIIINDRSPDNSIKILREFQAIDGRIVLIDKKVNEGVGKARNDGIKAAKGEFVIFMDSDDLYSNDTALEQLYNAAVENNVKVTSGFVEKFSENGDMESSNNPFEEYGLTFTKKGLTVYTDYQYDYGYTSCLFNRKMLIENSIFFPLYSRFQDPPFFVKAMCAAEDFYFIDEPVYRYRLLGGESKYTLKKTIDFISGVTDNLKFAKENNLAKLYCLSAHRLNAEGSFMAINNISIDENYELLSKLIQADNMVDVDWIKANGYDISEPFVLDYFKYAVDTANKYEKLRNKKMLKPIKRIFGK